MQTELAALRTQMEATPAGRGRAGLSSLCRLLVAVQEEIRN